MLECKNCHDQKVFRRKANLNLQMEVDENKVPIGDEEETVNRIVYICPRCGAEVGREDNE
jgi:ssDNA-binding Zn-finger/Zn-ribbon topoisomerase 1